MPTMKQESNCADRNPASQPPERPVLDPEREHRERPQRDYQRNDEAHQSANRMLGLFSANRPSTFSI